jgi:hypothetical protein
MTPRRLIALLALLPAVAWEDAHAQRRGETTEFWPELEFDYRIDDDNSLSLSSLVRESTDSRQLYRAEQEVVFNHTFADWFSAGAGYHHGNSTNASPYEDDDALLTQALHVGLPADFKVDFRTREEFRWLLSGFSFRLRERAKVQRQIRIEDYSFTPFAYAEVFYGSRYDTISRYRLEAGVTLPAYRALSVQPYYMREVSYTGNNTIRDVVGLVLIASF